jgi:hypothetical protein
VLSDLRAFGRESFSIFADDYRSRKLISLGMVVTFFEGNVTFQEFASGP